MQHFRFSISLLTIVLSFTLAVAAQTAPTVALRPVVSGLSSPLLATNAKDGTKRLFIVQQGGIIKVVQPGANAATDFLNITPKVRFSGEQGLLGLAFHPQFATNGYFFVNYVSIADGSTIIARYKTTDATNQLGDPNSERILLTIPQPFTNHKGGMIEFRTENGAHNLYIGMGDGGSGNDPGNRAQNINELLGKFLRITPDVSGNNTAPAYTVPADNPYAGATPGADEIYAIGLRNPFRWSFDRGGTHQLWAGDVGQGAREEVDIITLGGNYGWRILEGNICTPGVNPNCTPPPAYIAPVFDYSSASPSARCSVTGGYVYRGTRGALPNGAYVYGDYCTGEILLWRNNQQIPLLDIADFNLGSFGEDEDGEIYVCFLGSGLVQRIARANEVNEEANADFDGDGKTDLSVFRPSNGAWYILNSSNNSVRGLQFGADGDTPTPEDYDGDNLADISVFRPSNGAWYRINSGNNTFSGVLFGQTGDVPVAGDYDGDGKADISVFRPSNGTWYRINSGNNTFSGVLFGQTGDVPTQGDYDGDGKIDVSVFRPFNWSFYRIDSGTGNFSVARFSSGSQDTPVIGDYDGDGRADFASVTTTGNLVFKVYFSLSNTTQTTSFGAQGDVPVVGDYDGDDRDDIAVFRPSNGTWYTSTNAAINFGARQFGQNGDLPAPAYDKP